MDSCTVPVGSGPVDGTTGVGYAYSVPAPGVMQPKFYHPWGGYQPPPFSSDSNDSQPGLAYSPAAPDMRQMTAPDTRQLTSSEAQLTPTGSTQPVNKAEKLNVSPPPSRERFSYTRYQIELLNGIISKIRYPNSMQKQLVAKRVGITRDQVKIWFQNRRRKDVVGKVGKEDLGERTMVTDQVLDGIISELQSFQDDPKGRKIRPTAKARRRTVRPPSSPESEDSQPAITPVNTDTLAFASETYRPNFLHNGHPPAPTYLSQPYSSPQLVSPVPTMPVQAGAMYYPGPCLPQGSSTMLQPLENQARSSSPGPLASNRRSLDLFPAALEAIPMPIAGQSTALPVSSPSHNPSATTLETDTHTKVLTVLSATDESSNDSHYSLSAASSDTHTTASSPVTCTDQLDMKAPPNVVAPTAQALDTCNHGHGIKRTRSDASSSDEEEDEPPRKRQEYQPLHKIREETAPPNKTAPPSEPLRFDQAKARSPSNTPQDGASNISSPGAMQNPPATEQPWVSWAARSNEPKVSSHSEVKVPIPVRATPDIDFSQYPPYTRFGSLPATLKPACGPEMGAWPPYYGLPAGLGQPWDYPAEVPTLDINKNESLGGMPDPHSRPEHMAPWLRPSYAPPYLGPPIITNAADKRLK